MTYLDDLIKSRSNELKTQIKLLEKKLKKLPNTKFISSKNGKTTKWLTYQNNSWTFLPHSNKKLAEELALRRYYEQCLYEYQKEQHALDMYIHNFSKDKIKSDKMLESDSPYYNLLKPYIDNKNDNYMKWMSEPYPTNPFHEEKLTLETASGIFVRSKSEMLIADELYKKSIPFRYECGLEINGIMYFPDFTVLNPITGKRYYWEHLGMMDDQEYVQNALDKLAKYTRNGIMLHKNLIITTETKDQFLDHSTIAHVIQTYFPEVVY